jgi:hypothetical protein
MQLVEIDGLEAESVQGFAEGVDERWGEEEKVGWAGVGEDWGECESAGSVFR